MFWAYKTKIYAKQITMFTTSCLGCQQFFYISNEAVCPPFTWYEWVSFFLIEHLNVLEEILNVTIIAPVNFCARRYICERFSDCGRGENFINKAKCRFELSINQHAKYFQFRRPK